MTDKIAKSEQEWQKQLTPQQYQVCRQKGTERAFTGEYWNCRDRGIYRCVCCGAPLFDSESKFDSGTGWPSFWQPLEPDTVAAREDQSFFTRRTEVLCARCDAHLGHVFDDGPEPTGLRYCINSTSLKLEPYNKLHNELE
ncbi:peptide-methionine (R)-S-oxide reductase MsrB [Nitrosospira sp. Is2]|uniref:peptide-methionine (R)-S-oxide reductase MsrB n=1 Tax=Nitrosospira sp. Is2 TaxID=3080532 RepID=UPI0029535DC2|nr:peptide-methionine (R)-S-oxide reductase MsrB [Nitrosospira sp. Is2]WON74583.1 peptide-methionine (R)-S-oxide reductase MsrB [Nitrosospira sp. Is2]